MSLQRHINKQNQLKKMEFKKLKLKLSPLLPVTLASSEDL